MPWSDDSIDLFLVRSQQERFRQNGNVIASKLPYIKGDQLRLEQVIINLIKNALKFTPSGSIKIRASYDFSQNSIVVHVQDTGLGIEEEE